MKDLLSPNTEDKLNTPKHLGGKGKPYPSVNLTPNKRVN